MGILQDLINKSISDEKHGFSVATLPRDLDGNGEEAIVPAGMDLTLFDWKGVNIIHEGGGGTLCLYRCEVDRIQTKAGTHIELQNCWFLREMEFYGTTGLIIGTDILETSTFGRGCVVKLPSRHMVISEKSNLEFVRTNFSPPMRRVLEAEDSAISFQECRTTAEFNTCMSLIGCRLKISRSMFFSTYRCIEMFPLSSILVVSSSITGFLDMGLALVGVTGRVVDCTPLTSPDGSGDIGDESDPRNFIPPGTDAGDTLAKGIRGAGAVVRLSGGSSLQFRDTDLLGPPKGTHGKLHDWGIKCDVGSTAEFTSTNGLHGIGGGDYPAIECNGVGSSVTVTNYKRMICQNRACIVAQDSGRVVIEGAQEIIAVDDEALNASTGGVIELRRVGRAMGQTWGAVLADGGKIIIDGPMDQLEGAGDDGIICSGGSNIVVSDVTLIDGQTNGIVGTDDCSVTLVNVDKVEGKSEDGINLSGGKFLAKHLIPGDEPTIQGQKNGVVLSGSARGVIFGYTTIEGLTEDGISLSTDVSLATRNISTIRGQQAGVKMDTRCRWDHNGSDEIQGVSEEGIKASTACAITLEDVTTIEGVTGGLVMTDGNDYLHLDDVNTIHVTQGPGIEYEGSFLAINDITLIKVDGGGTLGNGLVIRQAQGKVARITEIDAIYGGMDVLDGADIEAIDIQKCSGLTEPHGITLSSSNFVGRRILFLLDGVANNSTGEFYNCSFGGAFKANDCSLKFSSCFINGHFEITDCSYDLLNTIGDGEHIATDSSGVSRNYTQNANYTATNETSQHTGLTLGADLILTDSSLTMDGNSVAGSTTATDSSLSAKNTAFSGNITATSCDIRLDNVTVAGTVDSLSGSTLRHGPGSISGKVTIDSGTAILSSGTYSGGIDCPNSSLEVNASNFGGLTTNGSGVVLRACNGGAVTLTGSALVSIGGTLGGIAVSGSSLQVIGTGGGTITGLNAKSGVPLGSDYFITAGSGKRYEIHDDKAVGWYHKDYRVRSEDELEMISRTQARREAPLIVDFQKNNPTDHDP